MLSIHKSVSSILIILSLHCHIQNHYAAHSPFILFPTALSLLPILLSRYTHRALLRPISASSNSPFPLYPHLTKVKDKSVINQTPRNTTTTSTPRTAPSDLMYQSVDAECDQREHEEENDNYYRYYVVFLNHFGGLYMYSEEVVEVVEVGCRCAYVCSGGEVTVV